MQGNYFPKSDGIACTSSSWQARAAWYQRSMPDRCSLTIMPLSRHDFAVTKNNQRYFLHVNTIQKYFPLVFIIKITY